MKSLRALFLGQCGEITDAGLFELRDLKRLRYIGLRGTRVTEAGHAYIRKALPKVKISR